MNNIKDGLDAKFEAVNSSAQRMKNKVLSENKPQKRKIQWKIPLVVTLLLLMGAVWFYSQIE